MKKEEDQEKQKEEEKDQEKFRRRMEEELEIVKKKLGIQKSYEIRGEIVFEERSKNVKLPKLIFTNFVGYRLVPPLEPVRN